MYNAIILDCDGVILNSESLHLKACNEVFSEYGIAFDEEEYYSKYLGLSDKDSMRMKLECSNIKFDEDSLKQLVERKKQVYISNLDNLQTLPYVPGVADFIKKSVSEGKTLGICTGSSREEVLLALKKLEKGGLIDYFKTIVTIDDIHNGKPNPEGYALACKNICQETCNCLAIEDSPAGVSAAITAGLSVYALLTTHSATKLKHATKIYKSFRDINKT